MHVYVITASKHGSTSEIGAAIARAPARARSRRDRDRCRGCRPPGRRERDRARQPDLHGQVAQAGPGGDGRARRRTSRGGSIFTFTVGPLGDPPKPDDAKPDEEVERFSAERAISHRMFTGKLDRSKLGRLERLAVEGGQGARWRLPRLARDRGLGRRDLRQLIEAQAPLAGLGPHALA